MCLRKRLRTRYATLESNEMKRKVEVIRKKIEENAGSFSTEMAAGLICLNAMSAGRLSVFTDVEVGQDWDSAIAEYGIPGCCIIPAVNEYGVWTLKSVCTSMAVDIGIGALHWQSHDIAFHKAMCKHGIASSLGLGDAVIKNDGVPVGHVSGSFEEWCWYMSVLVEIENELQNYSAN